MIKQVKAKRVEQAYKALKAFYSLTWKEFGPVFDLEGKALYGAVQHLHAKGHILKSGENYYLDPYTNYERVIKALYAEEKAREDYYKR